MTDTAGATGRAEGIDRVAIVPAPPPANDARDHGPALRALVDDLAGLAAQLCFSGRLPQEDSTRAKESRDKRGRDDV